MTTVELPSGSSNQDSESAHQRPSAPVVSATAVEADWDAYVFGHQAATLDHLWRWRHVFSGVFGHDCVYLAARRDAKIVGVLPLVRFRSRLFGRSVVSVPFLNYGGVLADDGPTAGALLHEAEAVARGFGARHLELRHSARQFPSLPVRQHKLALRRALPATAEALWENLDRKVRNQVRKAQKAGLSSTSGGGQLVSEFYPVFARNMRDLGTPVYSSRLFEQTLALFPERARVFVVRQETRALAAAIAIRFRDTVLVPWASSLREFRQLCPNMLLYWAMLEDAVATGARIFDFGRSSPDAGTHAFKLQWGAEATPLHWEYSLLAGATLPDHAPSSPRFHAAVQLWSRLPLWLANAAGPLVVRSIP